MKKQFTKAVSVILALIMLCTAVPLTAFAETSGYFTYTVENGEVAITGCDTSISGDVVIPDTIEGCPVTGIGGYAFSDCKSIASVTIPDSVTSIGNAAFSSCFGIENVTIGNSVTSIGNNAFNGCFKLTSISLPESLEKLGSFVFAFAPITTLYIPKNVKSIDGPLVFYGGFKGYTVDENNKYFTTDEYGALYNKDKTTLIHMPYNKDMTEYTVSDGVNSIGKNAFACDYNLKTINLPNSIKEIHGTAFAGCVSLKELNFPRGLEKIEAFSSNALGTSSMFEGCIALKKIVIPENCELESDVNLNGTMFIEEITVYDRDFDFTNYPVPSARTFKIKDGYYDYVKAEYIRMYSEYMAINLYYPDYISGNTDLIDPATDADQYIIDDAEPDYVVDGQNCYINNEITMRCYKGSTAEDFAKLHHMKIEYLCDEHNEETIPGYEATCVSDGLTDGVKCTLCNTIIVKQEVISAAPNAHTDKNGDGFCDYNCGHAFERPVEPENPDNVETPDLPELPEIELPEFSINIGNGIFATFFAKLMMLLTKIGKMLSSIAIIT